MHTVESPSLSMSLPQAVCSQPCHLCGSTEAVVLANRGRNGKPLRTVICTCCGLVWSDPFPHNPRAFYAQDYRLHYKGTSVPKPKHILRAGKLALARYRQIAPWLANPRVILDVGSGGGEFIYLLHRLGHRVQGIEPNRGYAEYAATTYDLPIQVGFAQEVELPEAHFDLITMWHVLEHTECPGDVLRKLATWLKPDGLLVIEVPNVEATCQAPQNRFHEAHLFNFNHATLQKLAEKAGLTTVSQGASADGGNITLLAQKVVEKSQAGVEVFLPGNAETIIRTVKGHTLLKHYATPTPYRRLLHRLRQYALEQYATRHFVGGRQLLDALYAPTIHRPLQTDDEHARPLAVNPHQ